VVNTEPGRGSGITVELDVEQFGTLVARQVAEHLAGMFPTEAGEFWAALCEQAYRERRRVAAMLDLTCPHPQQCPHVPDILSGIRFEGTPDEHLADTDPAPAAVDNGAGHQRGGMVAGHPQGHRTAPR
jgi:hypothetical protein